MSDNIEDYRQNQARVKRLCNFLDTYQNIGFSPISLELFFPEICPRNCRYIIEVAVRTSQVYRQVSLMNSQQSIIWRGNKKYPYLHVLTQNGIGEYLEKYNGSN